VESEGHALLRRRSLLTMGVAVPLAAAVGVAVTSGGATANTTASTVTQTPDLTPEAQQCNEVYICDSYFYVTDAGTVFFCEDYCDLDSDAYCETVCSECG